MSWQLLIIAAVVVGAVRYGGRASRNERTATLTNAQRWDRYQQRVDDDTGLESAEYLARVARGIDAKAKRLALMRQMEYLRAPVPKERSLVPVSPVRIRSMGHARRRHLRAVA